MIQLTSTSGEKQALPPAVIAAVFKPSDGSAPSAVLIRVNGQVRFQALVEQYGYVKKLIIDSMILPNPIEVTVIEAGNEGKAFFSRDNIIGFTEVKNQQPVNASIYVNLYPEAAMMTVKETVEALALTFPDPEPAVEIVEVSGEPEIEIVLKIEEAEEEQAALAADALEEYPEAAAPETTIPPAPEF